MNSKITDINYNELAAKFISDKELSLTIQQNISFVEKYVDNVEASFASDIEKQIVYRELGSITYSCIESLLKTVLFEINRRCKKRKCRQKCRYRKYLTIKEINNERTVEALRFILNTRLIGLSPQQIDDLVKLNNLRNYVHLSKNIGRKNNDHFFDKQYVYSMLDYYYELLNQLDLGDFYFKSKRSCLKMLDDDGFEYTAKDIHSSGKTYYLIKSSIVFDKLIKKEKLTEDDEHILKSLNDKRNVDEKEIANYVAKSLYYAKRHFGSADEFFDFKREYFDKLFRYIKNDDLVALILDTTNKE